MKLYEILGPNKVTIMLWDKEKKPRIPQVFFSMIIKKRTPKVFGAFGEFVLVVLLVVLVVLMVVSRVVVMILTYTQKVLEVLNGPHASCRATYF